MQVWALLDNMTLSMPWRTTVRGGQVAPPKLRGEKMNKLMLAAMAETQANPEVGRINHIN